jgi:glutathione S-transferase
MMTIFSSAGCPFAQRTRALLDHLDRPFEHREVDLDNRDPELLELSPTGKVPFLVDGDFRLFESSVINEYLAEKLGFEGAFPDDLELRALHRLVMRRWDDVVVPAFYRTLKRPDSLDDELRATLSRELAFLSAAVSRTPDDVENLLGLHLATHWARIDWLREFTPLAGLIDEHPALRRWLDRAAALPAILKTLPSREATIESYRQRYVATGGVS